MVDKETGLEIDAVRSFDPVRPIIDSPGKPISPSTAFLTVVPEISASVMARETSGFPVVTKLPSKSLISTSIEDESVRALLALTGEEIVR